MDLDEAAAIPFAIWALCNVFVIAILVGSWREHGYELIRGGLFLSYTAWTLGLVVSSINLMWDLPPAIVTAPWFVWLVAVMGASGALVMTRGLLRRDV